MIENEYSSFSFFFQPWVLQRHHDLVLDTKRFYRLLHSFVHVNFGQSFVLSVRRRYGTLTSMMEAE